MLRSASTALTPTPHNNSCPSLFWTELVSFSVTTKGRTAPNRAMSLHAFTPCIPLSKRPNTTSVTSVTRCVPQMTNSRNPRRKRPNKRPQDLFNFLDDEEVNPSRSRNNRMRRPRRGRDMDAAEEDGLDGGVNDVVDDAVDDGFFSRYRKDAENGRIFDVSGLDAEAKEEFKSSSANHQTAARAFDAVDKLFGNINAKKDQKPLESSSADDQIDKSLWLDDIKARAATSGASGSANAVDVQAFDESGTPRAAADESDFSEAQVTPDSDDKEPFDDSGRQQRSLQPTDSKVFERRTSQATDGSSFQKFMRFARRGPAPARVEESRERDLRKEKNNRGDLGRRSPTQSLSKILNNTRSFDRSSRERHEVEDDEMADEVEVDNTSPRRRNGRRQRFASVRRVGGKTQRILTPPREWEAMESEDVRHIRSDSRVLGGRLRPSHLRQAVADCTSCRGSGTETCALCAGCGWVAPMKQFAPSDREERKALYEEFWSTPGLVIDSHGNAQCIRCKGVGKQFCAHCKGSGSALETGFNYNDRYKVFDMFPDVKDEAMIENDYDEGDYEDEEEVEDNFESFQLYQGSVDWFGLSTGKGLKDDLEDKLEDDEVMLGVDDDEDEVLAAEDEDADALNVEDEEDMDEDEDESEELLEALASMDLKDKKRGDRMSGVFAPLEKGEELLEDEEDEEDDEDLDFEVEDDEFEEESEDSGEIYDLDLDDFADGVDDVNADSDDEGEFAFDEDEVGDEEEAEEVA